MPPTVSPRIVLVLMLSLDEIEVADTLVADNTADGLCEGVGHRELLYLGATLGVWDGVCKDNLLESRCLNTFAGWTTHDTV